MKMRQLAFGLIAMTVAACAPTLPPNRVAVSDFQSLAGTYTGTMNEASELNRSVRLVLEPNGAFELAVGNPKGFRTVGTMALVSDGSLTYQYNEMVGQGKVATGQGWVLKRVTGDGRSSCNAATARRRRRCPRRCPDAGSREAAPGSGLRGVSLAVSPLPRERSRRGETASETPRRPDPGRPRGSPRQRSVLDTVVFVEPSPRCRTIARRPSPS